MPRPLPLSRTLVSVGIKLWVHRLQRINDVLENRTHYITSRPSRACPGKVDPLFRDMLQFIEAARILITRVIQPEWNTR
jgi:hypothetical protein